MMRKFRSSSNAERLTTDDLGNLGKLLKDKETVIQIQAKRIRYLEDETERLRQERDSLLQQVERLSYLQKKDQDAMVVDCHSSKSLPPKPKVERSKSADPTQSGKPKVPPKFQRQQTVVGSGYKLQRQRSFKKSKDENGSRRRSNPGDTYELSQDLRERQVEVLERKYGGHLRAKIAARTIQQAYRTYCMNKNFQRLRSIKGEHRLARKLAVMGRSDSIWNDIVLHQEATASFSNSLDMGSPDSEGNYPTNSLQRKLSEYDNYHPAEDVVGSGTQQIARSEMSMANVVMRRIMKIDLDSGNTETTKKPRKSKHGFLQDGEETNNNRNSYPEQNDSSASDSPQETPHETLVDLPSVNFENLLESKETFNDNFHHSDSSSMNSSRGGSIGSLRSQRGSDASLTTYENFVRPRGGSTDVSYENLRSPYSEYHDNTGFHYHEGQHSKIATLPSPVERLTSFQQLCAKHEQEKTTYAAQEVRLRNKRGSTERSQGKPRTSPEESPIWKRKSLIGDGVINLKDDGKRMSNISETSEPDSIDGQGRSSCSSGSDVTINSSASDTNSYQKDLNRISSVSDSPKPHQRLSSKVSDKQRKRQYRIGLNLFNRKPEKGMRYLIERRFVENSSGAVAKFLIQRKGLSKQMIGEFLGNLQCIFNQDVLDCFVDEIDLAGLQVDVALRKFQTYFRMPGEAQKIERLMEAFARRYCMCNPDQVKKFRTEDTVFLLAFAIIMLNTDLHSPNVKPERKMKLQDFVKNLRGIDDGEDIDKDMLTGIYERIRQQEFRPGVDHVSQVMKVEQTIVGKKPALATPSRRLVCYCRLYEVNDPTKKEKIGLHQREVFLFNDIMVVTKIFAKKKNSITYTFRQTISLVGAQVFLFETPHYRHGIRLTSNLDSKPLITFNARNEHDRSKFVEDLKEAVMEMNDMEAMRIDEELQKHNRHSSDSGVVDIELLKPSHSGGDLTSNRLSAPELKKSTLVNSLVDLVDDSSVQRRGSGGSLDSGMVSAGSGTNIKEDVHARSKSPKSTASSKFSLFGKKSKPSKSQLRQSTLETSEA